VSVKLGNAKLPKGSANGLTAWEDRLAAKPDQAIPVVMLVRPGAIEQQLHVTDNPRIVKLEILGIEPVDGSEGQEVDGILRAVFSARTGLLALPFEGEDGRDLGKGTPE
jgi:hypothetical protein